MEGRPRRRSPIQMGTVISKALAAVGITEERVSRITGNCRCKKRIQKLNQISDWAWTVLKGSLDIREMSEEEKARAKSEFERIEGTP